MVPTIPNLVLRELVVALSLIAFILVFSIIFNAPLQVEANPGMSPNPSKAPWYFQGLQELLFHFHPVFAVFFIPVTVMLFLFLLPYLKYDSTESGIWFHSTKGRSMGVIAAVTAFVITPMYIFIDEQIIDFTGWFPVISPVISNGFIPALLVLATLTGFYVLIKKRYSATNNEAIQALFILLLVTFLIMMSTSIWFRGEGMVLTWP
jgi:quinol-cytochrome oxidoreductase complex cytochrome b subunit